MKKVLLFLMIAVVAFTCCVSCNSEATDTSEEKINAYNIWTANISRLLPWVNSSNASVDKTTAKTLLLTEASDWRILASKIADSTGNTFKYITVTHTDSPFFENKTTATDTTPCDAHIYFTSGTTITYVSDTDNKQSIIYDEGAELSWKMTLNNDNPALPITIKFVEDGVTTTLTLTAAEDKGTSVVSYPEYVVTGTYGGIAIDSSLANSPAFVSMINNAFFKRYT